MIELQHLYRELGLTQEFLNGLCLPKFKEETELLLADIGPDGKEKLLSIEATQHWKALKSKALSEGITLYTYSAYRSYSYQFELIKERMKRGEPLEEILRRLAPPGFSEHHTGRAVDVASPTFPHLAQAFDQSIEFKWLSQNATKFRFYMSYPEGNTSGIIYEPWHWCFR